MSVPNKKPLLLLLDAHAIIHRAYHALPNFATRDGLPTGAIFGFASMVVKIIADFKPDHIIACYDLPGKTFRHEAYDDYKGTRAKTDDTLTSQFDATRELCSVLGIPIYDVPGFEADDMLGTISYQLQNVAVDVIIVSGDMDTLQLVDGKRVQVFTLKKGMNDTVLYDEQAVRERFGFGPERIPDYKGLRGDPSDNIPGIKGIGEKAAEQVLSVFESIEKCYEALEQNNTELLEKSGLTARVLQLLREGKESAEFSKVLATIRRDAPITFTLPEQSWREHVDTKALQEFFIRYEFRGLRDRMSNLLGSESGEFTSQSAEKKEIKEHDEQAVLETTLALWLLDSDYKEADMDDILEYTHKETFQDGRQNIFMELESKVELHKVFEHIELPLVPIVSRMEQAGIRIDPIFFESLTQEYRLVLSQLEKQIHQYAGKEFNLRSPKQLSEILFETLSISTKGIKKSAKTGVYTTNADALEKLQGVHPVIDLVIQYRELDKLLGTYLEVLPRLVGVDGRLHPRFIQNGTTTGRFSSKDPNVQNIPTRTNIGRRIREGFVADEGYEFISFDYSQIELRCLAMLSNDQALIEIFKEGRDIHTAVASLIGGVPDEQVDRELRRKAKIVNFGILYGMGVTSLHKQMGGERKEAQLFHQGFFEQFPQATDFLESTKEHARKYGYTTTLFGRRRQFKDINAKIPFIRATAERMALNAPIQGTSADMIKLAMIAVDGYLSGGVSSDIRLVLQIHDEIIYEIKKDKVESFINDVLPLMEQVLGDSYLGYQSPVPLVVHTSHGTSWGDLK